jgi:hypothetical protein
MRLRRIPVFIRRTPWKERRAALQGLVNQILNARNVCPIGDYLCGLRANIIPVLHEHDHWSISANYRKDERHLSWLAEELERMS